MTYECKWAIGKSGQYLDLVKVKFAIVLCAMQGYYEEFLSPGLFVQSHLHSINKHNLFTIEEENDATIAILDTKPTRNPDETVKTTVYRKATHTGKYLQFSSHHSFQHRRLVARTLLYRAKNIPRSDADK